MDVLTAVGLMVGANLVVTLLVAYKLHVVHSELYDEIRKGQG